MTRRIWLVAAALAAAVTAAVSGQGGAGLTADALKGIEIRSIGPGLSTGRVQDIEIDPKNPNVWYVASAFGGLWKTENRGITFSPIFDEGRLVHALLRRRRSEGFQRGLARHGREHEPAQRPFRRRPVQVHRRRQELEARRAREVGAHREDHHRPAQFRDGLRLVAGAALVRGRRPRPVQDHRRRRDLDARAVHQRRHGDQRHRLPAGQARRHLRVRLPAAPRRGPDDRRRTRRGHLPDD